MRGSETILLAEDADALRELTSAMLERNGYTVLATENGKEAIRIAERQDQPIHLLLTDVVMPGMSGRELANYLAAKWPDMRVLYMSGYTSDSIVRHGVLEAGNFLHRKTIFSGSTDAQVARGARLRRKGRLRLIQLWRSIVVSASSLSHVEEDKVPQHALVVDDDLDTCKVIQAILRSADIEALISVDSVHAVELLSKPEI